jgi:hypothetical protein
MFRNSELIVAKPFSPALTATAAFAWRRNQPFPKATEKFIQYIKNELSKRAKLHRETMLKRHT